ncbi:magnesium transporter MgtC [Paramagnetospirillum kuznetsovii]|uniref:Protein MgtC n=1 Tax=Paramagnetospirillum kuznetsovii TaxID=2053833 RepID=A0A364NWL4_9PROT|nr:MgtC/SapB family protein [Paramagnetospirillum kuznetsovii]RAU21370.1 magnesium transporter MgtC [Paramagnetospirillum kuznetsovii]
MTPQHMDIAIHLASAWGAGSLVGLERSFHGRPAGFRTHALVCLASALLMLVTVYQWEWMGAVPLESIRTDPTRMAQGIMTGIGFLGAGVIFKEGLTVRGLTTAASIWITSALGIMYGVGFYYPAVIVTIITIATLALFRMVEYRMPTQFYAHHLLRFTKDKALPEAEVRRLIEDHGFTISNMSYRLGEAGAVFEYKMVIRTAAKDNVEKLVDCLRGRDDLMEFRLSPTGD